MPYLSADAILERIERAREELQKAVSQDARNAAREMAMALRAVYPVGPRHWRRGEIVGGGTLRRRVLFYERAGGWTVRSTAPHVHFWEGTAPDYRPTRPRYDPTRGNAYRGISPAHGPVFVPLAIRTRTEWLRAAAAMLTLHHNIDL